MKTNSILMGPVGTAKTTSLKTLLSSPVLGGKACVEKIVVQSLEPGIEHILGDIPKEKLAWNYLPPAKGLDWQTLIDNATKCNILDNERLQKVPGLNQEKYRQFISLLENLCNFHDQRTGEKLGPVEKFPENWALCFDGLTGLSKLGFDLVVGAKPIPSKPDYLVIQTNIQRLIDKLIGDLQCSFIMLSHARKITNDVTNATDTAMSSVGEKLAQKLLIPFDEVILAEKKGTTFTWSTAAVQVELKARRLPIKDGLPPDWGLIWKGK